MTISPVSDRAFDGWLAEASRPDFEKALRQNIQALEAEVRKGTLIDCGFFDIFKRDIEELKRLSVSQHKVVSGGASVYDELTERVNRAAVGICPQKPDVAKLNLVGAPLLPTELSCDDTGVSKKGLAALAEVGFSSRRIIGDGDCLFRSIACGLLTECHGEELEGQIRHIAQNPAFAGVNLQPVFESIKKVGAHQPLESVMNDPVMSNMWVSFLRRASTLCMREQIVADPLVKPTFIQMLRAHFVEFKDLPDDKAIMAYLARMESNNAHMYGGQPEIIALSNVFGKNITVYDAYLIATEQQPIPRAIPVGDIHLLLKGIHYQPLFMAS
jgi:hypothetical protein